jgi:hypothetical protein
MAFMTEVDGEEATSLDRAAQMITRIGSYGDLETRARRVVAQRSGL